MIMARVLKRITLKQSDGGVSPQTEATTKRSVLSENMNLPHSSSV